MFIAWRVAAPTRHILAENVILAELNKENTCLKSTKIGKQIMFCPLLSMMWWVETATRHAVTSCLSVRYDRMWRVMSFLWKYLYNKFLLPFLISVDFKQTFHWLKLTPFRFKAVIVMLVFCLYGKKPLLADTDVKFGAFWCMRRARRQMPKACII